MNHVSVACTKNDPAGFWVQKYDNRAGWNFPGGIAPNGVSATRYLRKTSPALEYLSPLAAWLFKHAPACVAGNLPRFDVTARVRCYSALTEAEELRKRARTPDCYGRHYVGAMWYLDPVEAMAAAERVIRCYAEQEMDQPARIDDWKFPIIGINQSDDDYWNGVAEQMIRAGVARVRIGAEEYVLPG